MTNKTKVSGAEVLFVFLVVISGYFASGVFFFERKLFEWIVVLLLSTMLVELEAIYLELVRKNGKEKEK